MLATSQLILSWKQLEAYCSIALVKLELLLNPSQQRLQDALVTGIMCLC